MLGLCSMKRMVWSNPSSWRSTFWLNNLHYFQCAPLAIRALARSYSKAIKHLGLYIFFGKPLPALYAKTGFCGTVWPEYAEIAEDIWFLLNFPEQANKKEEKLTTCQ